MVYKQKKTCCENIVKIAQQCKDVSLFFFYFLVIYNSLINYRDVNTKNSQNLPTRKIKQTKI